MEHLQASTSLKMNIAHFHSKNNTFPENIMLTGNTMCLGFVIQAGKDPSRYPCEALCSHMAHMQFANLTIMNLTKIAVADLLFKIKCNFLFFFLLLLLISSW